MENSFIRIIKKQYISLLAVPSLAIFALFVYLYTICTDLYEKHWVADTYGPILVSTQIQDGLFVIFALIIPLWHIIFFLLKRRKNHSEAFAYIVARTVSIGLPLYISLSLYPHFTQTINNFQSEKRFYMHKIQNDTSKSPDGKGKFITFETIVGKNPPTWCNIVYDETDTLLDPASKHRGLSAEHIYNTETHITDTVDVPIKITKLEPKFYYVCKEFNSIYDDKKGKIKEVFLIDLNSKNDDDRHFVVYDKTNTILNNIQKLEEWQVHGYGYYFISQYGDGKKYSVPTRVIKIKPDFYDVCFILSAARPIGN